MADPEQLDCSSIGRRQGVASHSGTVGACTCSVFAVSHTTLMSNISGLDLTSYIELLLSTLDDTLM